MLVFISDIHANLSALKAVYQDMVSLCGDGERKVFILGDIIDYGMRPNECIDFIKKHLSDAVVLEGNHENALLLRDRKRFSEERGRKASEYSESILSKDSLSFLQSFHTKGKYEFTALDKKILLIHGAADDIYWGKIDINVDAEKYRYYDYVVCGHTHIRFFFEKYVSSESQTMRNKKKVVFVNPGSVGQPRNHIASAQYAVCSNDLSNWQFRAVSYNIKDEMSLYNGEIDLFYKQRLEKGI